MVYSASEEHKKTPIYGGLARDLKVRRADRRTATSKNNPISQSGLPHGGVTITWLNITWPTCDMHVTVYVCMCHKLGHMRVT